MEWSTRSNQRSVIFKCCRIFYLHERIYKYTARSSWNLSIQSHETIISNIGIDSTKKINWLKNKEKACSHLLRRNSIELMFMRFSVLFLYFRYDHSGCSCNQQQTILTWLRLLNYLLWIFFKHSVYENVQQKNHGNN